MVYETTTRLDPHAALIATEQFFHENLGMDVRVRSQQDRGFEGGGGHVLVSIIDQQPTETTEWDAMVTEFIEHLPH